MARAAAWVPCAEHPPQPRDAEDVHEEAGVHGEGRSAVDGEDKKGEQLEEERRERALGAIKRVDESERRPQGAASAGSRGMWQARSAARAGSEEQSEEQSGEQSGERREPVASPMA